MLNASKMNEHLFLKVTVYLPFSFQNKISTKQVIASTESSYQFLAPKVPFSRRNKAPTSALIAIHFSAVMKTLVLGNLFELLRFAITDSRAVFHCG